MLGHSPCAGTRRHPARSLPRCRPSCLNPPRPSQSSHLHLLRFFSHAASSSFFFSLNNPHAGRLLCSPALVTHWRRVTRDDRHRGRALSGHASDDVVCVCVCVCVRRSSRLLQRCLYARVCVYLAHTATATHCWISRRVADDSKRACANPFPPTPPPLHLQAPFLLPFPLFRSARGMRHRHARAWLLLHCDTYYTRVSFCGEALPVGKKREEREREEGH